jgi:hypothetical protein
MSASAVTSVISLAPTVLSGIETIANDVASDAAAHKTVLQTASDALGSALTSATAIANSGGVGHNDANNINVSVQAVSLAQELIAPAEAAYNAFKALLAELHI